MGATLEVLREGEELTVAEVAERARVHETSIYRRWGTREALILDAVREGLAENVPVPDTDSLGGDLLRYARDSAAFLRTPLGASFAKAAAAAPANEEEAAARRGYWEHRLAEVGVVFQRAEERGELVAGSEVNVALEALLGALYLRLLVTRQPLEDEFVERLVGVVTPPAVSGDRSPAAEDD